MTNVTDAFDTFLSKPWRMGFSLLTVSGDLATPDRMFVSTIGDERHSGKQTLKGWERRVFPITVLLERAKVAVLSWAYYLFPAPKDLGFL